ncbi:MAG TPA: hypothetical protein VF756_05310 [Thermoanaerobaculia bacterium]
MSRKKRTGITLALALAAALLLSPGAAQAGALEAPAAFEDWSQLWTRVLGWLGLGDPAGGLSYVHSGSDSGPRTDPNGGPKATGDDGPRTDPNGGAQASTDDGPRIDPNG